MIIKKHPYFTSCCLLVYIILIIIFEKCFYTGLLNEYQHFNQLATLVIHLYLILFKPLLFFCIGGIITCLINICISKSTFLVKTRWTLVAGIILVIIWFVFIILHLITYFSNSAFSVLRVTLFASPLNYIFGYIVPLITGLLLLQGIHAKKG